MRRYRRLAKPKHARRRRPGGPNRQSSKHQKRAATHKVRRKFISAYYRIRSYTGRPLKAKVPAVLGLEANIEDYLHFAEQIIDTDARDVALDMSDCQFIWPSAITLLCSLRQWFELTRNQSTPFPRMASNRSKFDEVNSYLSHCGFYEYVNRPADTTNVRFDDDKVVKIVRETSKKNIEKRIRAIKALLGQFSALTPDEVEEFGDILPEVFLNVTEHGVNDAGWYTLTQYRPTTGVISLSVADNGIGIKNSLLTGPQRESLKEKFPLAARDDGDVILEAMQENISGAWDASNKTVSTFFGGKKYEQGKRRGLGLARIRDCCRRLQVPMTIVSGHGAVTISSGRSTPYNRQGRVFAGTLYHFLIRGKKEK